MKRDFRLKQVFNQFDEDQDDKLSPSELRRCVLLIGGELPLEEAEAVVQTLDSDDDRLLSLEDFVKLMEGEENMKELREAFKMYDIDDNIYVAAVVIKSPSLMKFNSAKCRRCECRRCERRHLNLFKSRRSGWRLQ